MKVFDLLAKGKQVRSRLRPAGFDAADGALNDEMDNLMPQFKSANATFAKDDPNARLIVDTPGGGGATPPTAPALPQP